MDPTPMFSVTKPEGTPPGQAGTPPTTPATQTQGTPEGQPQGQQPGTPSQQQTFWNGDPNTLSPELQQAYRNMQGDYTRKSQEIAEQRKAWEAEKQQYKQLEGELQTLKRDATNWQSWTPFLQKVSQPDIWRQVEALVNGQPLPGPQTQSQTQHPAQQSQTTPQDWGTDDEFVTVGKYKQHVDDYTRGLEQRLAQAVQQLVGQTWKEGQQWIQNYFGLADKLRRQELEHLYGMKPREGAFYDPMKVLQVAAEKGLQDLDAAFALAYGSQMLDQTLAAKEAQTKVDTDKLRQEIEAQVRKDYEQKIKNQELSLLPGGVPPRLDFNAKEGRLGYRGAEDKLKEALLQQGLRP